MRRYIFLAVLMLSLMLGISWKIGYVNGVIDAAHEDASWCVDSWQERYNEGWQASFDYYSKEDSKVSWAMKDAIESLRIECTAEIPKGITIYCQENEQPCLTWYSAFHFMNGTTTALYVPIVIKQWNGTDFEVTNVDGMIDEIIYFNTELRH